MAALEKTRQKRAMVAGFSISGKYDGLRDKILVD
jgi:hypothetical protein